MQRRTLIGLVSSGAALALVVGASIIWPGLDAQETPKVDTSVWALQTGDGRRYARVNTTIGELDTVRRISNPSEVVHAEGDAYVYSDGYSRLTRIDPAMPIDLDEETLRASPATPPGTTDVATAGDYAVYRTDTGLLYAGRLSDGSAMELDPFAADEPAESESPTPSASGDATGDATGDADSDADVDPDAEEAPPYTAEAIAVDERGMLFAYSASDEAVLTYDLAGARVVSRDELVIEDITAPSVTAAGGDWVVVDAEDGRVWRAGDPDPTETDTAGAVVVSEPDAEGDAVYLAGETSLVRVPIDGTGPSTEVGAGSTVLGVPARPVVHDGAVYAGWVAPAQTQGLLWDSRSGEQRILDYAGQSIGDDPRPAFVSSESALILNETRSGWVWTAPDGDLVASSQDWTLDERQNPAAEPSDEQLALVLDPKPPIAVADAFGVRPGTLSTLPVLLNDHDPNEDVLSIDPASVSGLDPAFGTVSVTDDGQRFSVRIAPDAAGSATFSYALTDGTSVDGLRSEAASVTLTVAAADADTPPTWCGVAGCLAEWPEPEVAPGGTVTVPVLPGWVDPEGDPLLLLGVQNSSGSGSVAATPDGDVVYQHADTGTGVEELVQIDVTVSDVRGRTATKPLVIRVLPAPEMTVQSFAVVDTMDTGLTVDVAPHVTGTAGAMSLSSVQVLDDAGATATANGGTTTFDFASAEPGVFRVGFTVSDGQSEATGTAKITIVAPDAPAQLATPPVIAFVRPQQDVTLDVFEVVANPTRRVLLLSDVRATAEDGATLSVDSVSQSHLRVSGATASGEPGRLGTVTYTVSDGTEDAGANVQGEATVYLLPEAPELAPIAVDDTVVVRAGSQIDIPVLENDMSPSGGAPMLNPARVVSSSEDALAFASGDILRYLAPEEAGTYGIAYSVYTAGSPGLTDTATVRVQVLEDDQNRAPVPEILEGRVLSGQATAIEFDGFGMDPDGDVVTLDRIVSQPGSGSATISADGSALVYASVPGESGQVSFRYRVIDSHGETGEGAVRVGVLDEESNPSPVTFTDYIQVQAGAESSIRIRPLTNDIDPTGGRLTLGDVRPDLPELNGDGTPSADYERVAEHIASSGDEEVIVTAGTDPGTMSFLYDVESSSGSVGRGLIVVKIVRESVPDYPVVADTVLTMENRDDFAQGVDVLEGKVSWSGGDAATLDLEVWGPQRDVTVSGDRLSGPLPEDARIIPFAVTGGTTEDPVQTYAFLRIPGERDVTLSLRSGISPVQVDELESATFDMQDLVVFPEDEALEVDPEGVAATGARGGATCSVEGGTVLRYDAGEGAPWNDACLVPVRVAGQDEDEWTVLSVPISIVAQDPQPLLRSASLTVSPGETKTFELRDITDWELREDWDSVAYGLEYGGGAFDVTVEGSVVTVTGKSESTPGGEEFATVTVTSHDAVAPARLVLRVGPRSSTLPQGGTVAQQCTQAAGSSCTITVIGAPGEVNAYPDTALTLVGAQTTGACEGITATVVSATDVQASWGADTPGTTCSISFTVEDAQQQRSVAEREGQVLLDLQGFPKTPAAVAQTAYDDGTLTLRVEPGAAALAYPALAGFVVRTDGAVVAECTADGTCPEISAENGLQKVYEVTAVNAVGESGGSVSTIAWAYNPPAAPAKVSVTPIVTEGEGHLVSLEITGVEAAQTGTLQITSATGDEVTVPVATGQATVEVPSYRVGTNKATDITVTPFSRFTLPAGLGGDLAGGARTGVGNGVGAPQNVELTLASTPGPGGLASVTATVSAASGGDGSTLVYGVVREGEKCVASSAKSSFTFGDLPDGQEYRFTACVESVLDETSFGRAGADGSVRAAQLREAPELWTFRIAAEPVVENGRADWRIREAPTSTEVLPRGNRSEIAPDPLAISVFGRDPGLQVRYVHAEWGDATPWAKIVPAPGSAPYQLRATWALGTCKGGSALGRTQDATETSRGSATITWDDAKIRFFDKDDKALKYAGDWVVPRGAVRVEGVRVTAAWKQDWNLAPATAVLTQKCTPNLPKPTPTKTPVPTKTPKPSKPAADSDSGER